MGATTLALVDSIRFADGTFDVLLVKPGASAVFRAREDANAQVPLIGLRCASYYRITGCLLYAGEEYGMQVGVIVSLVWQGRKLNITGPAVVLPDGLDLILPRSTLP